MNKAKFDVPMAFRPNLMLSGAKRVNYDGNILIS